MSHDIAPWTRVPAPNRGLSAYWHPPQVGRYRIRKFMPEQNEWFEGYGYYFGGIDMRWRLLKQEGDKWLNAGPLGIHGLEYHEE